MDPFYRDFFLLEMDTSVVAKNIFARHLIVKIVLKKKIFNEKIY